jgi:uncharacterized membrane protein
MTKQKPSRFQAAIFGEQSDSAVRKTSRLDSSKKSSQIVRKAKHPERTQLNMTILIAVITSTFGFIWKASCLNTGWALGNAVTKFIKPCYSDVASLYGPRGFADGIVPYFQMQADGQYLEYPVLIGIQMSLTSELTSILQPRSWGMFMSLNWIINLIFLLLAVKYLHKMSARAARWLAFSPALVLVLGINWDTLAVLTTITAIWFFQQGKYQQFGVVLGIGMSAKLFPILLLPVAIIYLYKDRNIDGIIRSVMGALYAWLAINIIFIVGAFQGWLRFFEFSRERGIDFGSPYLALSYLLNIQFSTSVANLVGFVLVAVAFALIYVFRDYITFEVAAVALIATFVVFNKVYSPQFWIWLAPLFALVIPKFWVWIQWNVAQVVYFAAIWAWIARNDMQYFVDNPPIYEIFKSHSISAEVYSLGILVHVFSTIFVVIYVVRHTMRNQPQLVRDQSHL